MDNARLVELLQPFAPGIELPAKLVEQLQLYLDLLLRWNARMNLTAVRDPEQIVTRHFGESLFAAQALKRHIERPKTLADIGSGAGFPGIPIRLFIPELQLTLIESQNKKATFLREVIRALRLENANVFCGRAEEWSEKANVVTLRAVEQFARVLPVATGLVADSGELCLLISVGQLDAASHLLGANWQLSEPILVPNSSSRSILIGHRAGEYTPSRENTDIL